MDYSVPRKLTSGRAWRTYTGGSLIDRIHGIEGSCDTQFVAVRPGWGRPWGEDRIVTRCFCNLILISI